MPNYQGVCLTAPSWRFVNVAIEREIEDLDHRTWENQPAEFGNLDAFCANYYKVQSLAGGAFSCSDSSVEAALRPTIMVRRPAWDGRTKNWELPQAIGICHGHALARTIRTQLPSWFDKKRGTGKVAVHPVAVPVAAVLAWAVGGQVEFPLQTLIVSGTSQVAEISAVRADMDSDRLHVQVIWTSELTQSDSPAAVQSNLTRLCHALARLPTRTAWRLDAFLDTAWMSKALKTLSTEAARQGLSLNSVPRTHDDLLLARGAACHAAFQQTAQLPNVPFTRLQYDDICVRDIGLMGDGKGGCYWHTLFPAGTSLPAESSELRIRGNCPSAFQLFEYTGESIPSTWNCADESFMKQVRWYGSGSLSVPRNMNPNRLRIQLQPGTSPDQIPPPAGQVSQV